jgi:branched-chain amino acid transport system substrate-binding protein
MSWIRHRAGLAALGLLLAAACGGGGTASQAQNGAPIKVGFIGTTTGVFAPQGADMMDGWKLGLKDAGDTVAGRKISTVFVDDAGDPNQGLSDARQLVENQGVDLLIGPLAANVALAVRGYVAGAGVPLLSAAACPDELATSQKSNNIILTGWTCDQPTLNFGKYVYEKLGYRHVTTIAMDYAFGWQVTGGFAATFKAAGGKLDKQIWSPITAADYSPFVAQIPSDTQAVFALMAGTAAVRFTDAYQAFGLKGRIPLIGGGTLTDYSVLRSEKAETVQDVITVLQYADGLDTAENRKFVDEYRAATNKYPSYYADSAYSTAVLLVDALKTVNGNTKDRAGLLKALKSTTFKAARGPVSISQDTNSPIQNIYIRKVAVVNGDLRNIVIDTIKQSRPWGPLSRSDWEAMVPKYGRSG